MLPKLLWWIVLKWGWQNAILWRYKAKFGSVFYQIWYKVHLYWRELLTWQKEKTLKMSSYLSSQQKWRHLHVPKEKPTTRVGLRFSHLDIMLSSFYSCCYVTLCEWQKIVSVVVVITSLCYAIIYLCLGTVLISWDASLCERKVAVLRLYLLTM